MVTWAACGEEIMTTSFGSVGGQNRVLPHLDASKG